MFGKSEKKKQILRLADYERELRDYESELRRQEDGCRIHMINPSRICPNPDQPRKQFDADGLSSLAESIKNYGMIQPITVRRMSDEDSPFGGLYELIAGERRLRAARMLDLPYVPCIIIEADRRESAKLSLVENLQRKSLGIFEEAEAMEALVRKYGVKQQQIAGTAGKDQQTRLVDLVGGLTVDGKDEVAGFESGLMRGRIAEHPSDQHAFRQFPAGAVFIRQFAQDHARP